MSGWLTIPNLITAVRIALAPFIGMAVARDDFRLAFLLFVIAAASDSLDGWLARRFHWVTRTGALLDPLADKFLIATFFIGLGVSRALPPWMVALVLSRDLLILGFAAWALAFRGLRDMPPRPSGKLCTFLQFATAAGAVTARLWPASPLLALYPVVFWSAVAATAGSGIDYFLAARRMLRRQTPD
jgi:cardiolipin synthase